MLCTCVNYCGTGGCIAAHSLPAFADASIFQMMGMSVTGDTEIWKRAKRRMGVVMLKSPPWIRRFYIMIRSGVLVDFKNLSPLKDRSHVQSEVFEVIGSHSTPVDTSTPKAYEGCS